MRKRISILLMAGFLFGLWLARGAGAEEQAGFDIFYVYTEKDDPANHYFASGWMGDYGAVSMDDNWLDNPYSGSSCIRFSYTGEYPQGAGWVGIYWQNPANNWGHTDDGFDLTGAEKLTFWARGEVGGEVIVDFGMGGITGEYSDSGSRVIGPTKLTKDWKQYTVTLEGVDTSYIIGGFYWSTSRRDNPGPIAFYLDDIKYE